MIFGISKSTINGVLALLITVLTAVLSYQVPAALLSPDLSHTWLIITAVCTLACGILRAIVGFLQNDSPTVPQIQGLAVSAVNTGVAPISAASIQPTSTIAAGAKIGVLLLVILLPALGLSGCTTWERATFQSLSSAKATIDGAHAAYEVSAALPGGSCATVTAGIACIPHTAAANAAITKAVQADTLTVQLMEQYEEDKAAGQSSTALNTAIVAVDNALTSLTTITAEVQALYGK